MKFRNYEDWKACVEAEVKRLVEEKIKKIKEVDNMIASADRKLVAEMDRLKKQQSGTKNAGLKDSLILTEDEVKKFFEVAEGTREKALVSFMYESGCRNGELLGIKISDLEFLENSAKVKLTSMAGNRTIMLVSCLPYLKAWIENEHPNQEHDSFLWVNKGTRNHGKPMSHESLNRLVKKWAERAGMTKNVTPHTFRRTRCAHLANKLPTSVLNQYMGYGSMRRW